MDIETIRAFFGWCTIINGGLLIYTFVTVTFAGNWVYRMHSHFFPMPRESFNVAMYSFIGAMKLFVLFLNLVPYLVLLIVT